MKLVGAAGFCLGMMAWGHVSNAAEQAPKRFEAGLRAGYVLGLAGGPELDATGMFQLGADFAIG